MLVVDPPATAGGTDIYPSSTPDFVGVGMVITEHPLHRSGRDADSEPSSRALRSIGCVPRPPSAAIYPPPAPDSAAVGAVPF
jgi:hypothetical protein